MQTFNQYQEAARSTAIYKSAFYPILGLTEEAGEVAGIFAKNVRDGGLLDRTRIVKELGDVLWMMAAVASDHNISLEEIAVANIAKLKDRQERGVLSGEGDNR